MSLVPRGPAHERQAPRCPHLREAGLEFVGLDPEAEFALMDHIFGGKDSVSG
jgi:hypothetical protein